MITLTPAAARQIHASTEQNALDDGLALRVAAHMAQDGSIEFGMGFDEQRDGDHAFTDKGVNLLVGKPSQALLSGTVLDFVEVEPGDFRFVFEAGACDASAATPSSGGACGSGGCNRCGGA